MHRYIIMYKLRAIFSTGIECRNMGNVHMQITFANLGLHCLISNW